MEGKQTVKKGREGRRKGKGSDAGRDRQGREGKRIREMRKWKGRERRVTGREGICKGKRREEKERKLFPYLSCDDRKSAQNFAKVLR